MQVIVLLLLAASLWGQSQLTLSSPGAQPVTGASAVTVGANRGQNIYYWVVARTPSGYTAPTNTVAFNTVGIANLDSSNYVTITWNAVPLATGYDVIRSSTATYPASTSCASCAVVLNQAGTTFNDQGGALSAYPPNGSLGVTDAAGNITIDNLSEQYPFANLQLQTGRYNYTTRLTDDRSKIVPCTIVSGTANAIVCNGSAQSPTRPPIATLTGAGRLATVISLIPGTTNSGATTINPDGLGVVTVQKLSSGALAALASGDLVAGVPYLLRYNGTVFVVDPGSGGGSSGSSSFVTVTHSATPTYTSPGSGPVTFYEVLTSNVTSSTLAGSLNAGQIFTFTLCQDGTGGRTYTYPTNVLNFPTPDTAPSACTSKTGYYDGSNVQCIDCLSGLGGVGQYLTASKGTSAATPPSGTVRLQARTTGDTFSVMRSTGAEFPLIGMSMDMPSGFCNNAIASAVGWSIAQSGVTTVATQGSCAGTYTDILPINFSNSNDPTIIRQFILPPNWVSTSPTYIDIWVHQNQAAASNNIGWKVRIGCESSGDAFNFAYNAYTSFSVATPTINTVLLMTSGAIATSGSSTCAAGSRASAYLQRDNAIGSNFAQTIQFLGARLYQ